MPLTLFENCPVAADANGGVIEEYTRLMQQDHRDLGAIGREVLSIVEATLDRVSDEEVRRYAHRGRGAEFTALNLYYDSEADDLLRLHVYPNPTEDNAYHAHSRRVYSTEFSGLLRNHVARPEECDPEDSRFDVYDCVIVDGACRPALNRQVGIRLREEGSKQVRPGETYTVETDEFHRVSVAAGTLTLCWFASTGIIAPMQEGRVVKPRNNRLEPIPDLVRQDLTELRYAVDCAA